MSNTETSKTGMSKALLWGRRRWIVVGTASAFVLGSAAVATAAVAGDGNGGPEDNGAGAQVATVDDDDNGAVSEAPEITPVQAAEAAAAEIEGALVTSVELDGPSDDPRWDVDLVSSGQEHDVKINATDGSVAKHDSEDEDDDDYNEAKQHYDESQVDMQGAVDAVASEVEGIVTSVELDDDNREGLGWEVKVVDGDGKNHELVVSATDGAVSTDKDGDRDDDNDDDDDEDQDDDDDDDDDDEDQDDDDDDGDDD